MFQGAVVVMGVSSCGKTSVAEALAHKLGARFVEGDQLHPPANVEKMSAGIALSDADRWPWLQLVGEALRGDVATVVSCSALKRSYREYITHAAQRRVSFVFLDGDKALLQRRISQRKNLFMPASLLDSQLATLEPPTADEDARRFDVVKPVMALVDDAYAWLTGQIQE